MQAVKTGIQYMHFQQQMFAGIKNKNIFLKKRHPVESLSAESTVLKACLSPVLRVQVLSSQQTSPGPQVMS